MKRTDKQIINYCERMIKKYDFDKELFREKILGYWIKYDLTHNQCKFLNDVKDRVKMPDWNLVNFKW